MTQTPLLESKDGSVTTLTLNRPEAKNALSSALRAALSAAFRAAQADPETQVLILTGAGDVFCAGFDLKEFASGSRGSDAATAGSDISTQLIPAIEAFEGVTIAAVNGPAVTAGFELALACDMIVASTAGSFGDTHARVGMLPGWGLSQRLPRAIGVYRAKELSLTGNFLGAERAYEWGLVNRVVPPEALLATCAELAKDVLSTHPRVRAGYKQLIDDGLDMPRGAAMRHESRIAMASAAVATAQMVSGRVAELENRGRSQSGRDGTEE